MTAADRLRALDEAMTPGPWQRRVASNLPGDGPIIAQEDAFDWIATVQVSNTPDWRQNAAGIIALRNALPALIEVVSAAEEGQRCSLLLSAEPAGVEMMGWSMERNRNLLRALAALDAALGGEE